jgi:hypothetical protein
MTPESTLDPAHALLACVTGAALALMIVVILHITSLRDALTAERAARAIAEKFVHCSPFPRNGDSMLITIRNEAGQLQTRCQLINDWRTPERIKP